VTASATGHVDCRIGFNDEHNLATKRQQRAQQSNAFGSLVSISHICSDDSPDRPALREPNMRQFFWFGNSGDGFVWSILQESGYSFPQQCSRRYDNRGPIFTHGSYCSAHNNASADQNGRFSGPLFRLPIRDTLIF
jgi:hypothetical protein